ncbi:MAG: DUF3429 domain-containing protein [Rhodobacterales bacterium]|nr:DUF3429 domain-containing protein [Rhodobacterales bacterium]NCT11311.1 DUF3429 domain-containing protein [Rhodobacterales bacterium]
MTGIPRAALGLGLAGLIPFLWGALTVLRPDLAAWGTGALGPRFVGPYVQLFYGAVILSFMSGVLWGFATRATGRVAAAGYALSVIPALWAFFMTGGGPVAAAMNLMAGFAGLLLLDWFFWRAGLAPAWWMRLRVLLTSIVLISLLPVVF